MEQAKGEVPELLRRRRHVKPTEPDNFGIASAESVIEQFRQVIGTGAVVNGGDFLPLACWWEVFG